MTTEKHDPWALLAEIHELQPWLSQDADLAARVEAALAEHDTVPLGEESDESKAIWRAYANRELSEDEAKAKLAALEAP